MKEYALVGRHKETGEHELYFPRWYWDNANKLVTSYGEHSGHAGAHMDYVTGKFVKLLFDLDGEAREFVQQYVKRVASFLDEPVEIMLLPKSWLDDQSSPDPEPYATITSIEEVQP